MHFSLMVENQANDRGDKQGPFLSPSKLVSTHLAVWSTSHSMARPQGATIESHKTVREIINTLNVGARKDCRTHLKSPVSQRITLR